MVLSRPYKNVRGRWCSTLEALCQYISVFLVTEAGKGSSFSNKCMSSCYDDVVWRLVPGGQWAIAAVPSRLRGTVVLRALPCALGRVHDGKPRKDVFHLHAELLDTYVNCKFEPRDLPNAVVVIRSH